MEHGTADLQKATGSDGVQVLNSANNLHHAACATIFSGPEDFEANVLADAIVNDFPKVDKALDVLVIAREQDVAWFKTRNPEFPIDHFFWWRILAEGTCWAPSENANDAEKTGSHRVAHTTFLFNLFGHSEATKFVVTLVEELGLKCSSANMLVVLDLLNSSNNSMKWEIEGTLRAIGSTGIQSNRMSVNVQDGASGRTARCTRSGLHVESIEVLTGMLVSML